MEKENLTTLIGQNLKTIRDHKGLSLDKASEQTGVSKPMLGQIERGVSNPTVSTLWKIASGLGVPFTSFLEESQPEVKVVEKAKIDPLIEADGKYHVYPVFPMESGRPFEFFSVQLLPGCNYDAKAHPHGVYEHIWVEEGILTLHIEETKYVLKKEEGIRFSADYDHTYTNNENIPCRATMIIHYPLT